MRKCSAMLLAALAFCAAQVFAANTHTVTFRKMDGTVLMQTNVVHGANATTLKPAQPSESGMTAKGWDCAEKLACVTNDVTCWALYEGATNMPMSTSIISKSVVDRETPYSLDEYFQMYNNLAWSDEFSGSSLDTGTAYSFWGQTYYQGGTWRYDDGNNNELEKYTTDGSNVTLSDGTLKITARRETKGDYQFTSAKIKTEGRVQFRYARCEIRAKLTKQQGTWPAFWMMSTGGSEYGEIDVLEQLNGSEWIGGCYHLEARKSTRDELSTLPNSGQVCTEDGTQWGDSFHRIGVIFTEFELVWYVDDHIFKRMDIRNKTRYSVLHDRTWYIFLNLAFGGGWPGMPYPDGNNDSRIANFQSEDYEIDYCRIFTNTTEGNTVVREAEPAGALLTAPVKATIWRGWQMNWAKSGSGYYMSHLVGSEANHIRTALREYFARDNPDIVTLMTKPSEMTGEYDKIMSYDVPGVSTLFLSPEQGSNYKEEVKGVYCGDTREKLLSAVMFNKERFSTTRSAISSLPLSNDADYTNCCAVVAELVEKDSGAKVKVVSVNVSQTNGIDYATLFTKLNQFKGERTILMFQSMESGYHNPLKSQASSRLDKAYHFLGERNANYAYQFSYATTNCVSATAAIPAPLTLGTSNSYANQSYCATVQFDAEPEVVIEYGQLDQSAFAKKMDVTFSGYSGTTLMDFPVLVKLSTAIDGFSYGDFQKENGGDLRFADSTGKLLPHEIDTWNPNGVSTVWVKVPSLAANAKITAYYGCANPPEVASKDVWDDDYVGVWHLGESALPLKESSETSSDFRTSTGSGIGYASAGIVGKSVDFGESGNSRSVIAPDHDALDGFTACTFEAWTYMDADARSFKKDGTDAAKGLLTKRTGYGNQASYHLWDAGSGTSICISSNSTTHTAIAGIANVPSGEWVHQVVTFNAGSTANYKGGAAAGTGTTPVKKINAGDANLHLGNFQAGDTRNFPGRIDEVRISKTARSAAWIKATHDTVANASFATYAVEGAAPVVHDPVLVVTVSSGTNTLSAITNVVDATWITNIVKRGAGTLVASGMPSSFSGLISVEAGVWQGGAGADDLGAAGTVIDVKDGASLALAGAGGASPAANVLSGKTVNLYGAKNSGALGKIHVSGTDTAVLGENVAINLKDADSVLYLGSSSWDTAKLKSGIVDLGGRKLTIQAPWKRFQTGATFTNGGVVKLLDVALYAEWLVPAFDGTGTLESNYAVDFPKKVNSQGWTLKSTGSAYGNVQRMPSENDFPGWEGPAQFTGSNAKLAIYTGSSASISNTVFNLKGAISGSGTLSVGAGWLNLHNANNTYSGNVFVNGQCVGEKATILPGSGGIGLWNGAACFTNATTLITFTNTARLAFMDNTKCSVGNVKFVTLAGETQSISGGVHTARSTLAGITKTGAGTLIVDSPAQFTGIADIQAGTLKIAYCSNTNAATQEAMLEPMPQFSSLKFASGTVLDLSDNVGMVLSDLEGAPCVTNSGMFGIGGKWKLDVPGERLLVTSELATLGGAGGVLCFLPGATFDLADEAAFKTAASGADGLLVAEAAWILDPSLLSGQVALPAPVSTLGAGWSMAIGKDSAGNDGRGLYLRYGDPSASGYAAWVAEKGLTGSDAAFEKVTNGIANGVRYAFDIDPAVATVGEPIIKVVRDADGNPVVETRALASGRSDVTFVILASEDLKDWTTLVPMKQFTTDGYWKPTASEESAYVFPAQLFFKYTIEVK